MTNQERIDQYIDKECRYCKNRYKKDCGYGITVMADDKEVTVKCVDYTPENPIRKKKIN